MRRSAGGGVNRVSRVLDTCAIKVDNIGVLHDTRHAGPSTCSVSTAHRIPHIVAGRGDYISSSMMRSRYAGLLVSIPFFNRFAAPHRATVCRVRTCEEEKGHFVEDDRTDIADRGLRMKYESKKYSCRQGKR